MKFTKINLIYFSATGTTAKIVSAIAEGMGIKDQTTYKIINSPKDTVSIPSDEPVIFGVPVFSGRVPEIAKIALDKIKGNNTPAVIVCVYGNREFDDALLELNDIVCHNGFKPISAAAFVAQHSIFPTVAYGRPDTDDLQMAGDFGRRSIELLTSAASTKLHIQGNNPYREIKKIPLTPKTSKSKCNQCGVCAKECPVQAIDKQTPSMTDKQRCIVCAHCIFVCPQEAKHFGGVIYSIAKSGFEKKNTEPKAPYIIYA